MVVWLRWRRHGGPQRPLRHGSGRWWGGCEASGGAPAHRSRGGKIRRPPRGAPRRDRQV